MDDKTRELLNDLDWHQVLPMLTAYAHRLIKQKVWRGAMNGGVPGGVSARDFALDAICAVCDGTRHWNPAKDPDIEMYLRLVVKSMISNLSVSAGNRRERNAESIEAQSEPRERDYDDFLIGLIEFLDDEPLLQKLVECVMDGLVIQGALARNAIAERLGISPGDVTNLKKRLQRKLTAYLATIQEA